MIETWQIWIILVLAGAINYLLRVIPLLVDRPLETDNDNLVIPFLEYAIFAIIGSVISSSLFSLDCLENLRELASLNNLLKLVAVLGAFGIYLRLKNLIISMFLTLFVYEIFWKLLKIS